MVRLQMEKFISHSFIHKWIQVVHVLELYTADSLKEVGQNTFTYKIR